MKTFPIDNSNIKNYNKNFDYSKFTPKLNYTYDMGAKTVTITDATILPEDHDIKNINITVHDDFGNEVNSSITASGVEVNALLQATADALTLKNSTAATTAAKLTTRNDAQTDFTADNTNVVKAEALGKAKAEYDAALATSTAASTAYDTAKAASDAAVAAADQTTGALDVSDLNASKGLNITATIVTDAGYTANGSAFKIVATGELDNWNKGEAATEQVAHV